LQLLLFLSVGAKTKKKISRIHSTCIRPKLGANAIKKFTPSLGIPKSEIGVGSKNCEPRVTPKSGLLNF